MRRPCKHPSDTTQHFHNTVHLPKSRRVYWICYANTIKRSVSLGTLYTRRQALPDKHPYEPFSDTNRKSYRVIHAPVLIAYIMRRSIIESVLQSGI